MLRGPEAVADDCLGVNAADAELKWSRTCNAEKSNSEERNECDRSNEEPLSSAVHTIPEDFEGQYLQCTSSGPSLPSGCPKKPAPLALPRLGFQGGTKIPTVDIGSILKAIAPSPCTGLFQERSHGISNSQKGVNDDPVGQLNINAALTMLNAMTMIATRSAVVLAG